MSIYEQFFLLVITVLGSLTVYRRLRIRESTSKYVAVKPRRPTTAQPHTQSSEE